MEPAALGELMNTLLTELSRVIRGDHLGTIDKYIGDCVMAFWGAPIDRPDHAAAATAAALDMQKALTALLPSLVVPEGAHIAVGIGLNTGKAVVGNMGSSYRMAYTVLGDTVNTASRLEGLTKAYGAAIVVGESVRAAAAEGFLWCELDWVRVKGRDRPLAIHEPLCRLAEADAPWREQVARHEQALVDYRERRFAQALDTWTALQAERPCKLFELWAERAQVARARRLVKLEAAAAAVLRAVQGGVCRQQQFFERLAVLRRKGHADAAVDGHHLVGADGNGPPQCGLHANGALFQRGPPGGIAEQDGELVAAQARHRVAFAHRLGQAPRHFHQHAVARGVAVQVVHGLEAVQVQHHHGVSARPLQQVLRPDRQPGAVGQAGQRVGAGFLGQRGGSGFKA
jgi:class 3 adenylate cyclase